MPEWMDELDTLMKGMSKPCPPAKDDDGDADDGFDDDEEDDGSEPAPPMKKSAKSGDYEPADNGDDGDEDLPNGAAVRDPDKIDRYTKGKKLNSKGVKAGSEGVSKSIRDLVDSDTADLVDASEPLGLIAAAVDNMAAQLYAKFSKSLKAVRAELAEVRAGQALIGQAVTKSLKGNGAILKSLQGEVEEMARQPRGRKAVTKGVERKFAGSDQPVQLPDRQTLMVKSLEAMRAGRISAMEAASVDTIVNRAIANGRYPELPPALLAKITG